MSCELKVQIVFEAMENLCRVQKGILQCHQNRPPGQQRRDAVITAVVYNGWPKK